MLNKNDSVLIMIDVQEKLVNMLDTPNKEEAASKSLKIIKAADILNIPFVITEQYPKGLGLTIEEIRTYLGEKYLPFEKTAFSLVKEEEIYNALIKEHKKQAVLFGIESHICVFQTAIELKEKGYEVYVVSDISFSRSDKEKEAARQQAEIDASNKAFQEDLDKKRRNSKRSNVIFAGVLGGNKSVGLGGQKNLLGL